MFNEVKINLLANRLNNRFNNSTFAGLNNGCRHEASRIIIKLGSPTENTVLPSRKHRNLV